MGCVMSQAEKEAMQRSIAIDRTLASENAYRAKEVKLLLLGGFDLAIYQRKLHACA